MIQWIRDWWYNRQIRRAHKVGGTVHDTNVQLERIAYALEMILLWQYGVSARAPVVHTAGPEPMTYATDPELMALTEELALLGFPPESVVGGSDGEDEDYEEDQARPSYHPV